MFRNIIWDVDGMLFDTYPAIARAFQLALNDLGTEACLQWIEGLAKTSLSYCVTTLAWQCQLNEKDIGKAFLMPSEVRIADPGFVITGDHYHEN